MIASTGASLAFSLKEKTSSAALVGDDSAKSMPTGKIGNVKISRLITGENQFSGWSHSRDLKYLRELFKAYSNEEKIMETLWSMRIKIMGYEMNHDSKGYGTLGAYPCQVQGGKFISIWPLERALKSHQFRK